MTKILVIEDEKSFRRGILNILEVEGFEAIEAKNGRIGVELARKHLPDLIVCDIKMPELNGYGVLFELRKHPLTASIPFIFLTGLVTDKDLRTGMKMGADDYLTKPFEARDLLDAVKTRLEKHAAVMRQADDLRLNLSSLLPHELRIPLEEVIGFAQFLTNINMLPEPSEIVSMAQCIFDDGFRLQRLLENYIVYVELRLMKHNPERLRKWRSDQIPVTKDIISNIVTEKVADLERQNDLILDLADTQIQAPEGSLEKIVGELVDNACKFSEPGTPIRIETKADGNQFILSVSDQGCGMTEEQIAGLGAYMQFKHDKHERRSSGLGLAIINILTELNDGNLTVESIPNDGTTVRATFNRLATQDETPYDLQFSKR